MMLYYCYIIFAFVAIITCIPSTTTGFVTFGSSSKYNVRNNIAYLTRTTTTTTRKHSQYTIIYSHTSSSIDNQENSRASRDSSATATYWIVRPATVHDYDTCAALIERSFTTLLPANYTDECLTKCLPYIITPRQQLLTCNTWYVVEHPSTRQIIGCGGYTIRNITVATNNATTKVDTVSKNETITVSTTANNNNNVNNNSKKIKNIGDKLSNYNSSSNIITDSNKNANKHLSNNTTSTTIIIPVPNLRHFAVHPDYKRQGIASILWERIKNNINNTIKPFPTIIVYSSLTGVSFYTSCGFEQIQQLNFTLNSTNNAVFPAILMQRKPT